MELGTRGGNSTCALVIGTAETGGHVVSVDYGMGAEYAGEKPTWDALAQASALVTVTLGLSDFWTLVIKDDLEFAKEYNEEIDLLFIDTVHSYEQTRKELEIWGSKVVNGGYILIHDTLSYPEQNKAIWEFLDQYPLSDYVEHKNCNGLGIIIKDVTPQQRSRKLNRDRESKADSREWKARADRLHEDLVRLRSRLSQELEARLEQSKEELRKQFKDPMGKLLVLYRARPDLRSSFPEVEKGDYSRLMEWAKKQAASGLDSAHRLLEQDSGWYTFNPWQKLSDENLELKTRVENMIRESVRLETGYESKLQALRTELSLAHESKLQALRTELSLAHEESSKFLAEMSAIRSSIGFKFMKFYASKIDRLFPDGTSRGEFRKVVRGSLKIVLDEGVGRFLRQAWWKLRRGEFRLSQPITSPILQDPYQKWLLRHAITQQRIIDIEKQIAALQYKPLISIIVPVYNTEPGYLSEAIESVRRQIYPNWELCIVDDASSEPNVRSIVTSFAEQDSRIKSRFLIEHEGIAGASNHALYMALGEFVGFLDHDDKLTEDALFEVVNLINVQPDLDFIYTDEDKCDENGVRSEAFFKPDWSPDLLLSMNYVPHFVVYRKILIDRIGGLRKGFEGSQDYDLTLRVSEITNRIGHVSKVLYSWRRARGSTASSSAAKPYARDAAKKALSEALTRRGIDGEVLDGYNLWYRIKYRVRGHPLVSIIVITHDRPDLLKACLQTVGAKTNYPNYEIIVVDRKSEKPVTLEYLRSLRHRVIRFDDEFNFAKVNNFAVDFAQGDYLVFLNDDTEVINPEWLTEMVSLADNRTDVGIVGAKLLYEDGRIQHAGVVLGAGGASGHPFRGKPDSHSGYFGFPHVMRNCIAVTAACMLVKRHVFEKLKGYDENLAVGGNDVDLCIRAYQMGYLTVYTPYASLYHHEGATRQGPFPISDYVYFTTKWRAMLTRDPFYNCNLSLRSEEDLFSTELGS